MGNRESTDINSQNINMPTCVATKDGINENEEKNIGLSDEKTQPNTKSDRENSEKDLLEHNRELHADETYTTCIGTENLKTTNETENDNYDISSDLTKCVETQSEVQTIFQTVPNEDMSLYDCHAKETVCNVVDLHTLDDVNKLDEHNLSCSENQTVMIKNDSENSTICEVDSVGISFRDTSDGNTSVKISPEFLYDENSSTESRLYENSNTLKGDVFPIQNNLDYTVSDDELRQKNNSTQLVPNSTQIIDCSEPNSDRDMETEAEFGQSKQKQTMCIDRDNNITRQSDETGKNYDSSSDSGESLVITENIVVGKFSPFGYLLENEHDLISSVSSLDPSEPRDGLESVLADDEYDSVTEILSYKTYTSEKRNAKIVVECSVVNANSSDSMSSCSDDSRSANFGRLFLGQNLVTNSGSLVTGGKTIYDGRDDSTKPARHMRWARRQMVDIHEHLHDLRLQLAAIDEKRAVASVENLQVVGTEDTDVASAE